jgi:hypothetical protein
VLYIDLTFKRSKYIPAYFNILGMGSVFKHAIERPDAIDSSKIVGKFSHDNPPLSLPD